MKYKNLIHFCFLAPFAVTALNAQVIVTFFVSTMLAQLIAYTNIGLILLGTILVSRQKGKLSKTASLWIVFYLIYFSIGILAGVNNHIASSLLLSTIPLMYTIGFYYYLSLEENRKLFEKTTLVFFVIVCIICIYWDSINFDLDYRGVNIYGDRAQGVYGDANNMALTAILTFFVVFKTLKISKTHIKILRIILLGIAAYSLFLTFSNTGFVAFIVSLLILNFRFFKGLRALLITILIPLVYIFLLNLNAITASMNLIGQQRDKINNIVNIVSFNLERIDDSGRSEFQSILMRYVYENPIFGNGINFGNSYHAHNTYLAIWADAGIFAIVFFMFMLLYYLITALKSSPEIKFYTLSMLFVLCIFMFSLQSVINQPYIMAIFIYIGYLLDFDIDKEHSES